MDFSRIEAKLDKQDAVLTEMRVDQATIKEDLRHHIRRTEALEKRVDSFWQKALLAVSLLSGIVVLFKHIADLAQ
jgi:hypothetical protein